MPGIHVIGSRKVRRGRSATTPRFCPAMTNSTMRLRIRASPIPFYMIYIISYQNRDPPWPTRPSQSTPPPSPGGLLDRPADRGAGRARRHRDAGDQYPAAVAAADGGVAEGTSAAVTSAITVFLAVFALGQLVVGPISDRYGRRWPVLIGFAVFFAGSVWCGLADRSAGSPDRPRDPGRRRLLDLGAVARDRPRPVFRRGAGRAMALIMIAMAAAPGFSPLLGGALDHYFGWRSEFALGRGLCRPRRPGLRRGARRNPSSDAYAARSACDRQKLSRPDRRPPLCGAGRDRQPDHGRAVRDIFGGAPRPDRGACISRRSSSACSSPAP